MSKIIDNIAAFDIPVNSVIGAVQLFNERAREGQYGSYGHVLRTILEQDFVVMEAPYDRIQVAYVIQETIKTYQAGGSKDVDPAKIYVTATKLARDFVESHAYVFAVKEEEVRLDASGKPKPKKGVKQVKAYEVYSRLVQEGASRKDIIEAFVVEVPLTKSGATTYFYNMKKKYNAENA